MTIEPMCATDEIGVPRMDLARYAEIASLFINRHQTKIGAVRFRDQVRRAGIELGIPPNDVALFYEELSARARSKR